MRLGVAVHVRLGEAAAVLLQLAADLNADLIVVGPHEKGMLDRRTVGSVTRALLREAHCPILVARPKEYFDIEMSDFVEPPCAECVRARADSHGETFLCELHVGHEIDRSHSSHGESRWSTIHGATRAPTRMF